MNRKERRSQLKAAGILKVKNMYGVFSEVGQLWYKKTAEEGAKLHAQNQEANQNRLEAMLMQKEADIKASYEANGYSSEKIELLLEAWRLTAVKYDYTYREDRKTARKLLSKAAALK
tara:strand:- start:230 stop:580 length:351 start_codon:yes stop_codon:yes gene_type:complete